MATKPTPKKKVAAPKKAAAIKKTVSPETVTMKSFFALLGAEQSLNKKQSEAMLARFVETVTGYLAKGDRVRMSGLGILQVQKRKARMGRNPATGEAIQIAASKKVAFRVAKELKEAV